MFNQIRNALVNEWNGYTINAVNYIKDHENGLERNSTTTRWAQYVAGKIDRTTTVEFATARIKKANNKKLAEKVSFLERVELADTVKSVSIAVEWKRNRTWGYNPTATVEVVTATGGVYRATGTASGCGYDKETAAVASALNTIDPIIKMLCVKKETALENGVTSGDTYNPDNSAYIHYGAGYGAIPYFEGGVGMSSFEGVFNACGMTMHNHNSTKHSDYYYFERGNN